jgi:hypothetical protein
VRDVVFGTPAGQAFRHHPVPAPLIGPHDPPVNIVGGYRFPGALQIDLNPASIPTPADPAALFAAAIPADLSIPEFLRRTKTAAPTREPAQAAECQP